MSSVKMIEIFEGAPLTAENLPEEGDYRFALLSTSEAYELYLDPLWGGHYGHSKLAHYALEQHNLSDKLLEMLPDEQEGDIKFCGMGTLEWGAGELKWYRHSPTEFPSREVIEKLIMGSDIKHDVSNLLCEEEIELYRQRPRTLL